MFRPRGLQGSGNRLMTLSKPCWSNSPSCSTSTSVRSCRPTSAAALSGARCARSMVAVRELPSTGLPFSGRRTDVIGGETLRYAHLLSHCCNAHTCWELTRLEAMWRGFVKAHEYADALGLVEASVKLICNNLSKLVEERKALAFEKQQRDAGLARFQ